MAATPSGPSDSSDAEASAAWSSGATGRVRVGVALALLLALFAGLRWNSLTAPLTRDEGEYAYAAQLLLDGDAATLPYRDSFLQKPPMVVYSYALAERVAPGAYWSARVWSALHVLVATLLLGWAVRRELGASTALLAMLFATPMLLLPQIEQFTANTEMFLLAPLLGVVALRSAARAGSRAWHWPAAGALAGVALAYKYTVVPILAVVALEWLWSEWRGRPASGSDAAHGRGPARALAGAAGLALGALGAFALAVLPFLLDDGGAALWKATVEFNRHYAAIHAFDAREFGTRVGDLLTQWWILAPLTALAFVRPRAHTFYWLALFAAAWLSTSASAYGHYYLVVMPFWAALAALGLERGVGSIESRRAGSARWLWPAGAALALVILLLPDARWMSYAPAEFHGRRLSRSNPFLESPLFAAELAERSAPDDSVWIAGSEPQILVYARRRSATRFTIVYPLTLPTPLAPELQAEALAELASEPPDWIVYVRAPTSWLIQDAENPSEPLPSIDALLASGAYRRVGGWVRTQAGPGRFAAPLNATLANASSLLLFQRVERDGREHPSAGAERTP